MKPAKFLGTLSIAFAIALMVVPSALASSTGPQPAANLNVSLGFSPNPVTQGSQTQIQISIANGVAPYFFWFNGSIPGCNPPTQPIQQNSSTGSYPCNPTASGSFFANLDVADSAGNHGTTSATLTVQSSGGTGGTGGNNTGGIDLSFLNNLLPIVMITGALFLGSTVAIAVSAVALAILVPRRLKQIRLALEGQPMKKPKASKTETPPPPSPSNEQPPQ